jgi:hypothetical protein
MWETTEMMAYFEALCLLCEGNKENHEQEATVSILAQ